MGYLDSVRARSVYRVREPTVLPRPLAFIGREAEMGVFRSLSDDADGGSGGTVFVSGDRGVGKSVSRRLWGAQAGGRRRAPCVRGQSVITSATVSTLSISSPGVSTVPVSAPPVSNSGTFSSAGWWS